MKLAMISDRKGQGYQVLDRPVIVDLWSSQNLPRSIQRRRYSHAITI
jgi:hypothetical protein